MKCQNCNNEFIIDEQDKDFYNRMSVPEPTFCPDCRLIRRLCFRNERTLYKGECQATKKPVFSLYSSDKLYKVYSQKYWWSDEWDPMDYGMDIDWNKPFLEQLNELIKDVPTTNLMGNYTTMVRSEHSNWAGDLKDCYLITDADYVENSAFGSGIFNCKDCFDCDNISDTELSYESYDLVKCSRTIGSVSCRDCLNIAFCQDCIGCQNCFGCKNLRQRSYYIFNKPYTKEEYEAKVKELWPLFEENKKKAKEFWLTQPHRHLRGFFNVKSFGDYLYNVKNTKYGFLSSHVEDSKYVTLLHSKSTKDCFDYTDWGEDVERVYESLAIGLGAYNIKFSYMTFKSVRDIEYGYYCRTSSDLFGCVSIHNKQYCILNKQYTKEEYEELVPKIKKHMNDMPYVDKKGRVYKYGEFFPIEFSPFCYNETVAHEYFPLTKKQAIAKGYAWKDREEKDIKITLKPEDLPKEIDESITKEVIGCEHKGECNEQCTKAFRIISQEVAFYKKMGLPLPRLCPNCRHYQRIKNRNPLKLWNRKCQCNDNNVYANTAEHFHGKDSCPNEFQTSNDPSKPEIVYCEECYKREVS